jgi:hypothetical protein
LDENNFSSAALISLQPTLTALTQKGLKILVEPTLKTGAHDKSRTEMKQ